MQFNQSGASCFFYLGCFSLRQRRKSSSCFWCRTKHLLLVRSQARLPVNAKIVGSVRSLTQSENPDQSVSEGAASGGGGGSVAETKRLEQHERGDSGPDLGQVVVCIRQRAEDVVFFAREENWQRCVSALIAAVCELVGGDFDSTPVDSPGPTSTTGFTCCVRTVNK